MAASSETKAGRWRGAVAFAFIAVNTVVWCLPVYLLAALRLLLAGRLRTACGSVMFRAVDGWVACVRWMAWTLRMVRVETLIDNPPEHPQLGTDAWYLVVCNHQSWADILVLTFALNGRIPQFKFFTKRQLVWVPFIGIALWLLGFPMVRRYSRERLRAHPSLRERDRETTRKACEGFRERPTSVLSFLEGTRFTPAKRLALGSPYQTLLKPRVGGFATVLEQLGEQIAAVVDVTIVYPGGAYSGNAPGFWDFLCGRCPSVELCARALPPPVPGDDIEEWVAEVWRQKDAQLQAARRPGAAAGY